MNDNFERQEAVSLWRSQTTKGSTIPVDEIRMRIERATARLRRERIIRIGALIVAMLAWLAVVIVGNDSLGVWIYAIEIAAYTVLLTQLPQMSALYISSRRLLSLELTSKSTPCMDFYRNELDLRRDALRQIRTSLAIAGSFGIALVFSRSKNPSFSIPFGISQIAAAIVWYLRVKRESPKIQQEIDELDVFRRSQNS